MKLRPVPLELQFGPEETVMVMLEGGGGGGGGVWARVRAVRVKRRGGRRRVRVYMVGFESELFRGESKF